MRRPQRLLRREVSEIVPVVIVGSLETDGNPDQENLRKPAIFKTQILDSGTIPAIINPASETTQFYRTVTNPAAGANASFTMAGGNAYMIGFYFQLVTDANAANRLVHVQLFQDATGTLLWADLVAGAVQAASVTHSYNAFPGLPLYATLLGATPNIVQYIPMPGHAKTKYTGTFVVKIIVNNIQVTDQLQNIVGITSS